MPVLSILIALALSTYAAVAGCLLSLWFYGREWRISEVTDLTAAMSRCAREVPFQDRCR